MKSLSFGTFIILLLCNPSLGQSLLSNGNFQNASTQDCPFDSTVQITWPDNWMVYQTLDDRWDSPVDSNRCISVIDVAYDVEVDLAQIDPARPLFIRYRTEQIMEDINIVPNILYHASSSFRFASDGHFNPSDTCNNNICCGIIAIFQVPNEINDSTSTRIHTANITDSSRYQSPNICIPSEYFSVQQLQEFIIKISFRSLPNTTERLSLRYGQISSHPYVSTIKSLTVPKDSYNGSTYNLSIAEAAGEYDITYLILFPDTTLYPNAANQSYVEVQLDENTVQQETINLVVDEFTALHFQPFTSLRGGLVENSDSLRHHVNLINYGSDLCVGWIDLLFTGPTKYIHQGGTIDLANGFSCMQFLDGGSLVVADNTHLHYGDRGVGVLALRQGGTIEIGKNSSLIINNLMVMNESRPGLSAQIYMELNEGSSLIFGEQARLSNTGSLGRNMKLNVYMNGGILDDRHLSAKERSLINKIYPDTPSPATASLKVYPHPAIELLYIEMDVPQNTPLQLSLYNLSGKQLLHHEQFLYAGTHSIEWPLNQLSTGIYYLQAQTQESRFTEKVLIVR